MEDLHRLLSFAQAAMPELQAVSSGAIASDYQRLRVENVRHVPAGLVAGGEASSTEQFLKAACVHALQRASEQPAFADT